MQNPERPISSITDDTLGRESFIHRISNALTTKEKATGVVIGLTGKWGSGKSSTLNMLQEHIQRSHPEAAVVNFNPWLITDKHDLINQFFAELITTINASPCVHKMRNYQFDLPKELINYAAAISSIADSVAPGLGIITKSSAELLAKSISRDTSIYGIRKKIEYELQRVCYPIVVLIDELDRVEDNEVRRVAQLIKGIADFPNISYLVAYDEKRVIEALGGKAGCCNEDKDWNERGRNYIEKIIQYPIPLPELGDSDLEEMTSNGLKLILGDKFLKDEEWNHTKERLNRLYEIIIPNLLSTPRDIKRTLGHFQVIFGITREEVDWVDVFGCSALQIKAPGTFNWIRSNADKVTQMADGMSFIRLDNTLKREYNEEDRKEKTIIAIKEIEHTYALRKLLKELFPVFVDASSETAPEHESPISNYHNFKLILTHGIITGNVPKKKIDLFLESSTLERHKILKEFLSSDSRDEFLEAFSGRYPFRNVIDEIKLWKDLSSFFKDPEQLEIKDKSKPVLINAAGHFEGLLSLLITEDKKLYPIEQDLVEALASTRDYNIVPYILRQYVFSYGLFGKTPRHNRQHIDVETVKKLSVNLSGEFERALENSPEKQINFNSSMFFLAGESCEWSDEFKQIIDTYIEDETQLIHLCSLLFEGNKIIERSFLIKIFNVEKLCGRLQRLRNDIPKDDLTQSYKSKVIYDSIEKLTVALPEN